jgi:hypothetical protein
MDGMKWETPWRMVVRAGTLRVEVEQVGQIWRAKKYRDTKVGAAFLGVAVGDSADEALTAVGYV